MTDRSNYGPVRRLSPSVSTDNRKPYSRTGLKGVLGTLDLNSGDTAVPTPSDSPYYPFHVETPQLEAPTQNRSSVPDGPRDIAGFPTYDQYQRIEGEYLSSLSERKQPKALISQELFNKIFAVLQNGSEDRGSTAQFRFWVRKMFVLAYPQTSFNRNTGQTPEPVVLHDKRPVAIKEQLYEVLCYCHAVARHGGRDKTCATLRLNYSWVPKELTAKFVKSCPTCTLKRSGNPDLLSQFGQTVSSSSYAPPPTVTVPPEPASLPVFPGGPNDSPPPGLSFVVGSEGCDDGGGGGNAGFGPSMFATPDLSVYPSPTLSVGSSLGPTTPSPYLSSGLFGYPAVFDPGHGSFSSVTGWDTSSLSPCGLMYPEESYAGISKQQKALMSTEEISGTQDMQLQLPMQVVVDPLCTHAHNSDCGNGGSGGDHDDGGSSTDSLLRMVGTPCAVDMGNVDPVLLTESRYSTFALVGPTRTATDDAEAHMDPSTGGPGGDGGSAGSYLHVLNLAGAATRNESPSSSNSDNRVFQHHHHHQYHHHLHRQQQHPHAPPLPQQLGLALGTTTPAMCEAAPISEHRQRQHRLLQLSPLTHDASCGDNNPLMDMIMFKFAPQPPPPTTGPLGVHQVVAAPTPTIPAATAAAAVLGMGMEIEVRREKTFTPVGA